MNLVKIFTKDKMRDFLKKYWFLILILLVGAFLRLYKIGSYMTFLGDEGRDAIVVRNLLVYGDPILIGPGTSVGGMYLGPLYYYFMAPFLFLANYSPVGPAVGVALLGVATIYLVYHVGHEWFNKRVGIIAAGLYAISPTAIIFSRASWNPNIMPFFSLLAIFSVWKAWKDQNYKWLMLTAVCFAFVLQSHYLGLLIAPVLLVSWLVSYKDVFKDLKLKRYLIKYTLWAVLIFAFLMSPLLIFDLRHDYMNSRALYKFFTVRQETVSIRPWNAIPKSYPIFEEINTSLLTAKNSLGKVVTLIITVWTIYFAIKSRKAIFKNSGFAIIVIWLATALIGFGVYKQHIYDHYFGFLFPVPFLLMALVLDHFKSKYLKLVSWVFLIVLIVINLLSNPLRFSPNMQMQRSRNVANKILEEVGPGPFNLAVLAERNYEDGYRYFLEIEGAKVLHADRWDKNSISEVLMVVCEMPKEKCDPTHSPKAEVANFGWSRIDTMWEVDGVIIYKLRHSQ